ncbi:MAG: GAF domain-containing protein [Anaerolineaceae bacterium]|nr:GAF domain-containing protein [Anaerolineaceae bacterium]
MNPKASSESLGSNEYLLHLLDQLLADSIYASAAETKALLSLTLTHLLNALTVDTAFACLNDAKRNSWQIFAKSTPSAWGAELRSLSQKQDLPWCSQKTLAGSVVRIDSPAELPKEAQSDRLFLTQRGIHALFVQPVFGQFAQVIGCVALTTTRTDRLWTDSDALFMSHLGHILAVIFKAQTNELNCAKRHRFTSTLNQLIQISLEENDVHAALQKIADHLQEELKIDFCGFSLWEEEDQHVQAIAAAGKRKEEFLSIGLPACRPSFTREVLAQEQPFLEVTKEEWDYHGFELIQKLPFASFLVFPLKSELSDFGAMFLGSTAETPFSDEVIHYSQTIATQVSLAINKISLFQKSQAQIDHLNASNSLSLALRNAQSLPEIPEVVIHQVIDVCQTDNAALIIPDSSKSMPFFFRHGCTWEDMTLEEFFDLYPEVKPLLASPNHTATASAGTSQPIRRQRNEQSNPESFLAFDLIAHNQSLGVFCVNSSACLDESKVRLLSAIADLVANAIYRQSLVDAMQVQIETLRKTRQQLVQSEKLAAIGELVAGVAHELNNPLTAINLWAEILHQQSVSEQDQYDLKKIISESKRASTIVQSLLDFSRQHTPEQKMVNLNLLVQNTIEMISFELNKRSIRCEYHLDPLLPETAADPYQIKQVLLNLVTNAIQSIPAERKDGMITVTTEFGPTHYFQQMNTGKCLRVTIEDNGSGIPPELMPRIFDPFFTTKPEGSGLGLSVCHGIITEHQGNIWAESSPRGGTQMFIELPLKTLPHLASLSEQWKMKPLCWKSCSGP